MTAHKYRSKLNGLSFPASAAVCLALAGHAPVMAQSQDRLVSACAGVSLPRSVVTEIVGPVVSGVAGPLEEAVDGLLGSLLVPLLGLSPDLDVTGLLTDAAEGKPITLEVLGTDGTILGPSDQCVATSDSIALDTPAGIAIGGNRISGLGAGGVSASQAYDIDAIALGNNAVAADGATGSIALGANARAVAASSIALGAGSQALRGPIGDYAAIGLAGSQSSAGELSVGSAGALRQITNVAAGYAPDDAATVGQVTGVRNQLSAQIAGLEATAVQYAGAARDVVTLAGAAGTRITNLAAGSLTHGSTDAVAGGQLAQLGDQLATLIGPGSIVDPATGLADAGLTYDGRGFGDVQGVVSAIETSLGNLAVGGVGGGSPYFHTNSVGPVAHAVAPDSVAIGPDAIAAAEGSVALGAGSLAERGAVTDYSAFGMAAAQSSAGEIAIARLNDSTGSRPLGARQITGVAAGGADTDAVNVAQLRGAAGNLGTAMAASLGGGATFDSTTGMLSGGSYILNGTSYDNVGAALSGLAAQVGASAASAVTYDSALRDRVTLAGPAGTVLANVGPGTVAAGSMEAVNGGQLAATNAQVEANSAAIALLGTSLGMSAGPVRYADAATPTTPNGGVPSNDVTLVGAAADAPVRLHNVADGAIVAGSTDAVNGGQVAAIAATAGNSIQYNRTASGDRADRVTLAGGTPGAAVTLANVADGAVNASSTEAVNGRQLAATNAALASTAGTSAAALVTAQQAARVSANSVQYDSAANMVTFTHPGDFPATAPVTLRNVAAGVELTDAVNVGQLGDAMNMSVAASTAYTDMRLQQLDFRLDDLRRDAEAGTAAAMAMAQIPSLEGELTLGGGAGIWQGESAMALGLAHRTDRRRINMAATYTSRGQAGAAVGVGFALR